MKYYSSPIITKRPLFLHKHANDPLNFYFNLWIFKLITLLINNKLSLKAKLLNTKNIKLLKKRLIYCTSLKIGFFSKNTPSKSITKDSITLSSLILVFVKKTEGYKTSPFANPHRVLYT